MPKNLPVLPKILLIFRHSGCIFPYIDNLASSKDEYVGNEQNSGVFSALEEKNIAYTKKTIITEKGVWLGSHMRRIFKPLTREHFSKKSGLPQYSPQRLKKQFADREIIDIRIRLW